jgi:hypothetical protein
MADRTDIVMPDRDKFRKLPMGWRPAAHSLAAFAQGIAASVDQTAIERGLAKELRGLSTLAPTLHLFEAFHRQPPLVLEMALEDLARVTSGVGYGRNDSLLREEAERLLLRGEFDPGQLVQHFLRGLLRHNVIESKGGVAESLRAKWLSIDSSHLLDAVKPTIESAATQLLDRPSRKRLAFAHRRPVDLDTDLLGAQW